MLNLGWGGGTRRAILGPRRRFRGLGTPSPQSTLSSSELLQLQPRTTSFQHTPELNSLVLFDVPEKVHHG